MFLACTHLLFSSGERDCWLRFMWCIWNRQGFWPGCLAGPHVINIYTVGEGRRGLCLVWDKSTLCVSEYMSSAKVMLPVRVSSQMISANKQLIENADAVQERIAQVQKEGEFVDGGLICSTDCGYVRPCMMKIQPRYSTSSSYCSRIISTTLYNINQHLCLWAHFCCTVRSSVTGKAYTG